MYFKKAKQNDSKQQKTKRKTNQMATAAVSMAH
jgi:hypothetical protein